MSDIFEVIKETNITISIPNHGHRVAVEIFPYKDGAVFFDVGWNMSTAHPTHIIPGPISGGKTYWEFGDYEKDGDWQAWVFDPRTDSQLIGNNEMWEEYKKTREGKKYASREKSLKYFESEYRL